MIHNLQAVDPKLWRVKWSQQDGGYLNDLIGSSIQSFIFRSVTTFNRIEVCDESWVVTVFSFWSFGLIRDRNYLDSH